MESRLTVFPRSQNCLQGHMLLEKEKVLGTLHESALLHQAPCSLFPTDYPWDRVKTQARSTTH